MRDRGGPGVVAPATHPRLLLVEDSAADAELASVRLRRSRFEVVATDRLSSALNLMRAREFDCLLLDLGLPDAQGLEGLQRIHVEMPAVPVVVLTGAADPALETEALRQGAQDYLRKDEADEGALRRTILHAIERQDTGARLARLASEDTLTRLATRGRFLEWLRLAVEHPRRHGDVAVIFLDLDGFKVVNDHHGHAVGDQVLAEAARRIAAVVRPGDLAARLGGDEFVVGCEAVVDERDATAVAERLVSRLSEPYAVPGLGRALLIGASAGVAMHCRDDGDAASLVEAADRACYEAKRRGGRRAVNDSADGATRTPTTSQPATPGGAVGDLAPWDAGRSDAPHVPAAVDHDPAGRIVHRLARMLSGGAVVMRLADDGTTLEPVAWWHPDGEIRRRLDQVMPKARPDTSDALLGAAVESPRPVVRHAGDALGVMGDLCADIGPDLDDVSLWACAVRSQDRVVGVLVSCTHGARRAQDVDERLLRTTVSDMAAELGQALLVERLDRQVERLRAQTRAFAYEASLLSTLNDAVVATDRDGVITTWNHAAQRLYGHCAEEVIGRPVAEVLRTEFTDGVTTVDDAMRQVDEGHQWRGDVVQRHRDGRRIPVAASVAAVFDADGTKVGLVAVNREAVHEAAVRRRLEVQDQLGREVLDTIGANAVIVDRTGRITAANRAWERFCHANGGDMTRCGAGVDYLEVCDRAAATGDTQAEDVAGALRALLRGDANEYQGEYDCDSPRERRTMRMLAVRTGDGGLVVSHADISWRNALEADVEFHATRDSVTTLPNRELLADRLAMALRTSTRPFAVLFLNLDRFKEVNDGFGYGAGDEVLRVIGRRLSLDQPSARTIGRFGADGFAVVAPDVTDQETAMALAHQLLRAVAHPIMLGSHRLLLTASLGVAMTSRGDEALDVIRHADAAAHLAKARGGGRFCFYSDELQRRAATSLALREDLVQAIEEGRITLALQPIFAPSGDLTAYEALARWHDPRRHDVPPSEFIPFAERTGLIHPLGHLVLKQSLDAATRLVAGTLFVNLSAHELVDPALASRLSDAIGRAGVAPHRFGVEVTETAVMADPEVVKRTLRTLRDTGVKVHLDDFGTGYSSLAYLAELPLDGVKIDRSFVASLPSPHATAIIRAVVEVGEALDLHVVAEGVETEQQRAALVEMGCSHLQGYLLGRPAPLEELIHVRHR